MTPRRGGIYPMHETSNRRRRDARQIQAGWFSTATFQPARMPVAVGRLTSIVVNFTRPPRRGCAYAAVEGGGWSGSVGPRGAGKRTNSTGDEVLLGLPSNSTPVGGVS